MLYLGTYYNRKVLSNWKQVRERSDTSLSWLVSHCCIFINYMFSITLVSSPSRKMCIKIPNHRVTPTWWQHEIQSKAPWEPSLKSSNININPTTGFQIPSYLYSPWWLTVCTLLHRQSNQLNLYNYRLLLLVCVLLWRLTLR